jgi:hypothetical protein
METSQGISGNRRQDRRYDIRLNLSWKMLRRRRVIESGAGQTIDLSSGGILFETGRALPEGMNVELSIQWPVSMANRTPLQLTVSGRIIRAGGGWAAIRTAHQEFAPSLAENHPATEPRMAESYHPVGLARITETSLNY